MGRWYIAIVQYSSLCEGPVVNSLDVVDIGEEVLGRVQLECEREEVNNGETWEGQNEEASNRQPNTHRGWHENGMNARYTDTFSGSSWTMMYTIMRCEVRGKNDVWGVSVYKKVCTSSSSQAQTIMSLYKLEILRGGGKTKLSQTDNVWSCILKKIKEVIKIRIKSEITERAAVTKERDEIPSPSGRQETAFSGRQVGLVQQENLVVSTIACLGKPRDIIGRSEEHMSFRPETSRC